jgi:Ran GTPase-activating protein (RanGAP) involved in mRNA processing and transport
MQLQIVWFGVSTLIVRRYNLGSLQELDISGNPLGNESLQNLFKVLPNSKITNIIMKNLRLTKEIMAIVDGIRQENNMTLAE